MGYTVFPKDGLLVPPIQAFEMFLTSAVHGSTGLPKVLRFAHVTFDYISNIPSLTLPPPLSPLHGKHVSLKHLPCHGLDFDNCDRSVCPPISIIFTLHCRSSLPLVSISFRILHKMPPGVHGTKSTVEKPPSLYQVSFF